MLKTAPLSLNFRKKYCLLLCLGLILNLFAQDEEEDKGWKKYHYDVLGEAWVGYLSPQFYGDNFLSEAFDTGDGIIFGINVLPSDKWYAGAQFSSFRGDVTNTSLVGVFDATRIQQFYITGGHSFLKQESRLSLKGGIGAGYVGLRNERGFERFRDEGFGIMADLVVSYRLTTFLGIYASLQHQWLFMDIDVPADLRSFFRNVTLFAPSIGIKFSML